jgi:hypothetical protein
MAPPYGRSASSPCMQVLTMARAPFSPQVRAGLNTGIVKEVERRVQALDQVSATECH